MDWAERLRWKVLRTFGALPTGERVRAVRYLADFTYYRFDGSAWQYVVEDVKSRATRTETYRIKRKLMAERLGLTITEV